MIPSVLSQQLQWSIEDFLRITFPVSTPFFHGLIDRLLAEDGSVFTVSKGLTGVGFSRTEWEQIRQMKNGTVEHTIEDDTLPGGPRQRTILYEVPFDRCDRERDYEVVWTEFERRFSTRGVTVDPKRLYNSYCIRTKRSSCLVVARVQQSP